MSDLRDLASRMLERALAEGADEALVRAARSEDRRVAFERGELNLAAAGDETVLSLTVHKDHRLASAHTNSASPEDIERTVRSALDIARFSTPDEQLYMPDPKPVLATNARFDRAMAALGSTELRDLTRDYLASIQVDDRVSVDSGAIEWEVGEECLLSSHGVDVSDRWTHLDWTGAAQGLDGDEVTSFDYRSGMSWRLAGAGERMIADGRRLGHDVVSCFGAARADSYRGRVLLTPRAVDDLILDPLEYHLSGMQVLYGKSSFDDERVGTEIASSLLTLVDDPTDIELDGCTSYDSEGMPAVTTDFVRGGRLERHLESAYSARCRGKALTGHADQGLHAPVIFPKDAALDDLLMGGEGEPLLVLHRFSGNVDGSSGDFSGVAKGSFLITPDGERRPVKETMIAGNFFEMLRAIEAVENATEVVDGKLKAPHILVGGVSVTGQD